jgi:hypothetical protein
MEIIQEEDHPIRGMWNQQSTMERNECRRGVSPRRPSTSRHQRSFNHCEGNNKREDHDQLRHEFKRTTSQRGSLASRYQSFFLVIVLLVITLDIKL